jgi:type I restriction enzyme R subunit
VRYKEVLDGIGHVTREIVVSPPDDNDRNEKVDKTGSVRFASADEASH